jgi:hypothetical protein
MSSEERSQHYIEDWLVLKYGWLLVFVVHVAFLGIGVWQIKTALDLWAPDLISPEARRLDHVIHAVYMIAISFSILLLILAVFVLEIFRNQYKLMRRLDEMLPQRASSVPAPPAPPPAPAPGLPPPA